MCHLWVHPRLRADSEVVHYRILRGKALLSDGGDVTVDVHIALADFDFAAASDHVPRTMGIVPEHRTDGVQ